MNSNLLTKVEKSHTKQQAISFKVGDTVEVNNIIREGDKQRIQKFKGLVMAIKGSGTAKMFTVRKISYGIGVEKIFPFHSPNVAAVTVIKPGSVRRSKIYFMRKRVGRSALKVKPGSPMVVVEHESEAMPEEYTPEMAVAEEPSAEQEVETTATVEETPAEATAEVAAEETPAEEAAQA